MAYYRANDAIQALDTDANALTMEQVKALANWADCQTASLFDAMPLQFVLTVYHGSSDYETFESWLEEEPRKAAGFYNRHLPADKLDSHRLEYRP